MADCTQMPLIDEVLTWRSRDRIEGEQIADITPRVGLNIPTTVKTIPARNAIEHSTHMIIPAHILSSQQECGCGRTKVSEIAVEFISVLGTYICPRLSTALTEQIDHHIQSATKALKAQPLYTI